jgi:hypothetical protein
MPARWQISFARAGPTRQKSFWRNAPHLGGLGALEHLDERAQFDALGVGLDLPRVLRQVVDRAGKLDRLVARRDVGDPGVRVGDRRLLEVLVNRLAPLLIPGLQLDCDLRAVAFGEQRVVLGVLGVADDLGPVLGRVDLQHDLVGRFALAGLGDDEHRLARGHEAVHARRRDADALLAAGHLHPVELRAVQQLAEDVLDLLLDDARSVVADGHLEAGLVQRHHLDAKVGENRPLLAGVEGVVDRLLHGDQERLSGVVESQQMAVLGEELADRDLPLPGGHRFRRGPRALAAAGAARRFLGPGGFLCPGHGRVAPRCGGGVQTGAHGGHPWRIGF